MKDKTFIKLINIYREVININAKIDDITEFTAKYLINKGVQIKDLGNKENLELVITHIKKYAQYK